MHFFGHFLKALGLLTSLQTLISCSPAPNLPSYGQQNCKDVVIPITLSANNIRTAPTTTFKQALTLVTDKISGILNLLFDELVSGTYDIAGTYCEPAHYNASRANTIQFLVHGATVNARHYWSGDGPIGAGFDGTRYSWVDYASREGYPTFFIDRLGNGLSSHPDPIAIVQTPTEASILHHLTLMLKSGSSPFPRAFQKVIVVGHSLGSIIVQLFSVTYPNDASAIILTGYSKYVANILAGIFVTGELLPADLTLPSEYGKLGIGYLLPNSPSGLLYLFWYDPFSNGTFYNPSFPPFDYALRECITVGEGATGALSAATSAFSGDVLVITGQQDTLFCGTLGLPINGPGECVGGPVNYLKDTGDLYPNANYEYWSVPNAGHLWQFHYSAQEGFKRAHEFLERCF